MRIPKYLSDQVLFESRILRCMEAEFILFARKLSGMMTDVYMADRLRNLVQSIC